MKVKVDTLIQSALALEKQGRLSEAKINLADAISLLNQEAMVATNQAEKARLISRSDDIADYIRVRGNEASAKPSDRSPTSSVSVANVESCDITFKDVKGLDEVKRILRRLFVYPVKFPHIYRRFGLQPGGGAILYGAPGCGKTLLAQALAGEIGAKLIKASCSTLLGIYLSESEKQVTALLQNAVQEAARCPVIVFFDEFDAIAAARKGRDHEAMNRVVSQLLIEISEAIREGVIVIGATNRFEALDSALLRYGRFNKWVNIPLPDAQTRALIADADLKNAPCQEDGFADLVAELTEAQNGADVRGLVEEARQLAAERQVEMEMRGVLEPQEVTLDDIVKAAEEHCHTA